MRLQSPAIRDALSAEYVLGTLRGQARVRFERYLSEDDQLIEQVNLWEGLLEGFSSRVRPVTAPPSVWRQIEHRLGFTSSRFKAAVPVAPVPGLRWWRGGWLGFGIVAMLALAVMFRPDGIVDGFNPDIQIALQNKQARTVWKIRADTQSDTLVVSAVRPIRLPEGRSLELWLLPKSGGPPISLGLMPTRMDNKYVATAKAALAEAAAFAVSLEPHGGSPTGAPTGPVLYVSEVGAS